MTITNRDSKGRILPGGKVLSSEEAKEIGSLQKGKKEKQSSADQLLQDAGYDNPEAAPMRKRLMAKEAAGGSVPAIKSFATKGEIEAETPAGYPLPGEKCPTCRQYVLADMQIDDDFLEGIIYELDLGMVGSYTPEGLKTEIARLTKLLENYQAPSQPQEKIDIAEESQPDLVQDTGDDPITQ